MSTTPLPPQAKTRRSRAGWRFCRVAFRWCRILVLLTILSLILAALYLDRVGVPDFVKQRAVARLRAHGWKVEFSRLRLHWYRGIVAEHLSLQRTNDALGPQIFIDLAECQLDPLALTRWDAQIRAVSLTQGRLLLPWPGTNQTQRLLPIEGIHGKLTFDSENTWTLHSLRAHALGARINFSGTITNGSAIRDWRLPPVKKGGPSTGRWRWVAETLEQSRFSHPPEVVVTFTGDAHELKGFQIGFRIIMPDVNSPWLTATNVALSAQLFPPPTTNTPAYASIRFKADDTRSLWGGAQAVNLNWHVEPSWSKNLAHHARGRIELTAAKTRWGNANELRASIYMHPDPANEALRHTQLKVSATRFASDWFSFANAATELLVRHAATNLRPESLEMQAGLEQAGNRWGNASAAAIRGQFAFPATNQFRLWQTNLTWTERLEGIPFLASINATNVQAPKLHVQSLQLTSHWHAAKLIVDTTAQLHDGDAIAHGELDTRTHRLAFNGSTRFDLQQIMPLLRTNTQRWITNYSWKTTPLFEAAGHITLPEWTNGQPNWKRDVLPTLSLQGRFDIRDGAYRGVPCSRAQSAFIFTNETWHLPELIVTRPEGMMAASYSEHSRTREFQARLHSTIDPQALRPIVRNEKALRAFDFVRFTAAPRVEGEVRGRWRQHDRLSFDARVTATNLTLRDEQVKEVVARVVYTNRFVTVLEPEVQRDGEKATATVIGIDIPQQRVYLTNVFGDLNAYAVARAISKPAIRAIEPYVFQSSPTVRINGVVDARKGGQEDDLHFEVSGGPFRWRKFRFQKISGKVDWLGSTVALTNVHGLMHGGHVSGAAHFDVLGARRGGLAFRVAISEIDLQKLTLDVASRPNKLEGLLGGELTVTDANFTNYQSWQGYGHVQLHDGLIWEIPIFGVFSPVLDTIMPGLGHSRAKHGMASFTVTNSVVYTDDLEIRAATMRMQYRGKVDFKGRVDGRVEAELLRDLPAVGFLVSKVLWPLTKVFEYRIAGTFNEPKTEPVYIIPKLLLLPFNPIKGVKEIFSNPEVTPPKENPTKPPTP